MFRDFRVRFLRGCDALIENNRQRYKKYTINCPHTNQEFIEIPVADLQPYPKEQVEDIHETLSTYHKVARERVINNNIVRDVGELLFMKENSPLTILTPGDMVDSLIEKLVRLGLPERPILACTGRRSL